MNSLQKIYIETGTLPIKLNQRINQFSKHKYNPKGSSIFQLDWDNLIILDACRYDIFSNVNNLSGELDYRYSLASTTPQYINANFENKPRRDTVVVSANPHYFTDTCTDIEVFDSEFVKHSPTNSDKFDLINKYQNEDISTALPSTVVDSAISRHNEYPNKRLIVHFLQPHAPYFGPTAAKNIEDIPQHLNLFSHTHELHNLLFGQIDVSLKILRTCYKETLVYCLESVDKLLKKLHGKTIITADHGEMLGERGYPIPFRFFGHGYNYFNDELTKVPILTVPFSNRKKIKNGETTTSRSDSSGKVTERLKGLGYIQ